MRPNIYLTGETGGSVDPSPRSLLVGPHRGRTPQKWWQDTLTLIGGRNRFGEPNVRIAWSEDRFALEGGIWRDYDANGILCREEFVMRRVPRYPWIEERWILETWVAPERYGSPDDFFWSTSEIYRGQRVPVEVYPTFGDYEWSATIGVGGRYAEPNEQSLVYAAYYTQHWTRISAAKRLLMKRSEKEREEREFDSWGYDVVDDARGPFYGEFVSFAGLRAPKRSPIVHPDGSVSVTKLTGPLA